MNAKTVVLNGERMNYDNRLDYSMYGLFRHLQECRGIKCVFVTLIIFYTFVLHLF